MGLFSKIFKGSAVNMATGGFFETLTGYTPHFHSFSGGIYEAELCRAAIHSIAVQCSKLKIEVQGKAQERLKQKLIYQPNPFQDSTKFLYKLATILETENTAFIVPIYDEVGEIDGLYPVRASDVAVKEYGGEPYLEYTFATGKRAAMEFGKCGMLTKYLYKDDFFAEDNRALRETLNMITMQNQAIEEGVKQSASIRFIAMLAKIFKPEDIEAERKRFIEDNLNMSNNGGVLLGDAKFSSITPIKSEPYVVPDEQAKMIRQNVFDYFQTNENIITSAYNDDEFNAFYENKIEPFALQLSLVLTNMLFSNREKSLGNSIIVTSNRLQQASNTAKLEVVTQLFDRGFITHNQGCEIFNLPTRPDGDKYFIRREYAEVKEMTKETEDEK